MQVRSVEDELIRIPADRGGPPNIGHGGIVAGIFFERLGGPVRVRLRQPAPLDRDLRIAAGIDGMQLLDGDTVIAEGARTEMAPVVPRPPTLDAARRTAPRSPAHRDGRGVHPTCFGCSVHKAPDAGLGIAAGPLEVDGVAMVAAGWTPDAAFCGTDGMVEPRYVAAALDCPGAFAFITEGEPAGLLGQITLTQDAPVLGGEPHLVTGWRIGQEGRKLLAGTAIFDSAGTRLAVAEAVWFPMRRPRPA